MSRPGRRASAVASTRAGPRRGDQVALAAAAIVFTAALSAQGGRISPWLDITANLAPVWLGAGIALAAYGFVIARSGKGAIVALALLTALSAGALMAPEFLRPIPISPGAARTIRIIQFNVWDENRAVPATADWIVAERPDIVVMEEAEPPIRAALLARGFIITTGFGHTVIFSRAAPLRRPSRLHLDEWAQMPAFARATFPSPAGEFTVVGVHLPEPEYAEEAPRRLMLTKMLSRYDPERLILAGDFNLTPWSFGLRRLDRSLALARLDRAAFSWPAKLGFGAFRVSGLPILPIDHLYAGPGWRLVRLVRGPAMGSDHRPLVVDLAAAGSARLAT